MCRVLFQLNIFILLYNVRAENYYDNDDIEPKAAVFLNPNYHDADQLPLGNPNKKLNYPYEPDNVQEDHIDVEIEPETTGRLDEPDLGDPHYQLNNPPDPENIQDDYIDVEIEPETTGRLDEPAPGDPNYQQDDYIDVEIEPETTGRLDEPAPGDPNYQQDDYIDVEIEPETTGRLDEPAPGDPNYQQDDYIDVEIEPETTGRLDEPAPGDPNYQQDDYIDVEIEPETTGRLDEPAPGDPNYQQADYIDVEIEPETTGRLDEPALGNPHYQLNNPSNPDNIDEEDYTNYKAELAAGNLAEIRGSNPNYYQPDAYPDFSRRFIPQYHYSEIDKKPRNGEETGGPVPMLASPEFVLAIAKESEILNAAEPINPTDELLKKDILRTGKYWDSFWKEDANPQLLRQRTDERLEPWRIEIQPGSRLYDLVSELSPFNSSPTLLFVINPSS